MKSHRSDFCGKGLLDPICECHQGDVFVCQRCGHRIECHDRAELPLSKTIGKWTAYHWKAGAGDRRP